MKQRIQRFGTVATGMFAVAMMPFLASAQGGDAHILPVRRPPGQVLNAATTSTSGTRPLLERQILRERRDIRTTASTTDGRDAFIQTPGNTARDRLQAQRGSTTGTTTDSRREIMQGVINRIERGGALGSTTASSTAVRRDILLKAQQRIQDLEARRTAFQQNMQTRIDALRDHVGEVRAARIEQYFNNMTQRIETMIDRMHTTADLIESRIKKIADAGKDTTAVTALLAGVRTKISDASVALDAAKTAYQTLAQSAEPQQAFADVRTAAQDVAEKMKAAHQALVHAVEGLKAAAQ